MDRAATPVDPRVLNAMLPFFTEMFGNAASITHAFGNEARDAVESARGQIGRLLNCDPNTIIFTSGATEANNIALLGILRAAGAGKHLIVNAAEHKAILDPAGELEREGYVVTVLPVDNHGIVDPSTVASSIRPETVLVSTMWANNEVGTINPLIEIGEICRDRGVLFHTDATQAAGCVPIDLKSMPIDLLSLSAHKMYGSKGVGALYIRRGSPRIKIQPVMFGGGHERKLRSGTLPVPMIVGLGMACELCHQEMKDERKHLTDLRNRLWQGIRESIDDVQLNGHPTDRLPGNANITFRGVNSDALMLQLKDVVAVSTGSACTTADPQPSHVLTAMGLPLDRIASTLRFGIGRFNTVEEIEIIVECTVSAVNRLKKLVR